MPKPAALILAFSLCFAQGPPAQKAGRFQLPTVDPKPEEKARIEAKTGEIDAAVRMLGGKHSEQLLADVEIYAKAGKWLLEFPGFFAQQDIGNALAVLDKGIERAKELQQGRAPWVAQKGRKIHGYVSALDGSLQPYGVSIPESYDGSKPVRLYVWLHGRNPRLTEASFIHTYPTPLAPNSNAASADLGQIQIDCYGRGNNANHWPGEVDVFEAIADVQKRYRIDPDRIILRGFSLGGAAAWHLALHHPGYWAAAEIGAGTWPRRSRMPGFPPHQAAVLRIWENIVEWALNAYNLPIAAHDGDSDTQVASIPPPPAGAPTRGQLESSIRVREQLEKEGFPSEGTPNALAAKGTPSIFLISEKTGHATSADTRKRLDAFLKQWGDRGRTSPDRVRFLSYTTRYNRSYWVTFEGLDKHYERAEIDAQRLDGGARYEVATKNLRRVTLRETDLASQIQIDGQTLRVKGAREITLEKAGTAWRVAGKWTGLHKTHALQGPIDDAFLDPYLLVKPTGTPWNKAAHDESLRILERFDRAYARNYRAHPRVKNDTEVTAEDLARYNVALFGDPGSNRWIAKVAGKLPLKWTRDSIAATGKTWSAQGHVPVMVYPNPLNPKKYVVINSGLTIDEREYNSDYSMPRFGDAAILKIQEGEMPEAVFASIFDEQWRFPASGR